MAPIRITVEGVGGVKLSTEKEFDKWLKSEGVKCLLDDDNDKIIGFESLVDGGRYTLGPQQKQQDPPEIDNLLKRASEEILDRFNLKRRRIEGKRPARFLSYVSKSHAFESIEVKNRLECGVDFFFPLAQMPFTTRAFGERAPGADQDENSYHHDYFLKQMKLFVGSALRAKVDLKQQLYWSKSGKWMKLDDGTAVGVEPDFCMTEIVNKSKMVPDTKEGVKPPQSKYNVSVAMEMKKGFVDSDQLEALDYGERLLCFQRGRRRTYTALFHCCENDKSIRWLETREENGDFRTRISRPESLAPGGVGQRQLLTILTRSSEELGLDFPKVFSLENELASITSLVGVGATSTVYAASFREQNGVLKIMKDGFQQLADHEAEILDHLRRNGVPGIPSDCVKVRDGALFFGEELAHVDLMDKNQLSALVDCLRGAHNAGVVHRDVRPDNIMQDTNGSIRLIDWGFAYLKGSTSSIPQFEGTFRYASDEVLESAISGSKLREPEIRDDLESLVRIVVSQPHPWLQDELARIESGDLEATRTFWAEKRRTNPQFEWMFDLAKACNYESFTKVFFG